MPTTQIKICGITCPEDATFAAKLGVDAIGLNFVAGPRKITYSQASKIIYDLPAATAVVGLVTAPSPENPNTPTIRELLSLDQGDFPLTIHIFQTYGNDMLKIYGCGPNDNRIPVMYWPVIHVTNAHFPTELRKRFGDNYESLHQPAGFVLDTASEKLGGSGKSFNWHWIAEARAAGELDNLPPLILAGGLTPENVADAIRIARPYAVDVSSGVEIPNRPGIKDPLKIRDFIQAVRSTDTPDPPI